MTSQSPEQVALRRLATSLERVSTEADPTLPRQYRDGVRDGLKIAAATARGIADEWPRDESQRIPGNDGGVS